MRARGKLFAFCILVFAIHSSFAALTTQAWVKSVEQRWSDYTDSVWYDTVLVATSSGGVRLNSVSISARPVGSYLEIVEDAWISSSSLYSQSVIRYDITGTLHLPLKSAIVGIALSIDEEHLTAKVHPHYPQNYAIDTTRGNPLVMVRYNGTRNVGHWWETRLREAYGFSLIGIEPGKEYRFRLRYLMPNLESAQPNYNASVVFDGGSGRPGTIEIRNSADTLERKMALSMGNLTYQLNRGQSLQVPFRSDFTLSIIDSAHSMFHTTSFPDGDWKGKYLMLNTSIPDSIMGKLSKEIETVVLWRWNRPSSFVRKYFVQYEGGSREEYKYITSYGEQAVTQAEAIRRFLDEVSSYGKHTGMVHSIQFKKPISFPLSLRNSTQHIQLETYLAQFTREYFENSQYFELDAAPDNPPVANIDSTDSSRCEFLSSMKVVNGLYSNGQGIMKHLIIISCGPVRRSQNILTLEELDTLFRNTTVDCRHAVWRDVADPLVKQASLQSPLVAMGSFMVPEFRPASILLQVNSTTKSYQFPLSPDQASFSIIAKAQGEWNTQMVWLGYDRSGKAFSTAYSKPAIANYAQDTGLVKLWAVNDDRLNDTRETNIGMTYGVISQNAAMKIYPTYKGYDSTATAFAAIEKVYTPYSLDPNSPDDRPPPVRTQVTREKTKHFMLSCINRVLRISLPGNERIRRVTIYSVSGRVLATVSPDKYLNDEMYSIPIAALIGSAPSMFIVKVEGVRNTWKQKVALGR